MKFVRALGVQRGERQNDETHYVFHCGTKKQTANQWVLLQKNQLAACPVVNRRCRASDKKVQYDPKNIGADASLESLPPQQAPGHHERNVPSKQHARL